MAPHQKRLVQGSFAQIVPIADTVAALFYATLFELDPSLLALFTSDVTEQGRKLMRMLAVAVGGLDYLEVLVPVIRSLGQRHASYGVRDDDYEAGAVALLTALEAGLGAAFTAEVREAWTMGYWLLADTMKAGAAGGVSTKSA